MQLRVAAEAVFLELGFAPPRLGEYVSTLLEGVPGDDYPSIQLQRAKVLGVIAEQIPGMLELWRTKVLPKLEAKAWR